MDFWQPRHARPRNTRSRAVPCVYLELRAAVQGCNNVPHGAELPGRVLELEIVPERNEYVVGHVSALALAHYGSEGPGSPFRVVPRHLRHARVFKVKAAGGAIVGVQDVGEYPQVKVFCVGELRAVPQKLHVPGGFEAALCVKMYAVDHHRIVAEKGEQRGSHGGVPERIDLPAYLGADSESLQQKRVPLRHLVDDAFQRRVGLVVLHPPPTDELQLSAIHKGFETPPVLEVLGDPPSLKEADLCPNEASAAVGPELGQYAGEDMGDVLLVVTLEGVQPPRVTVGVGYDVHM